MIQIEELEELRLFLGWPQSKMADNLEISPSTYSRWARGDSKPGSHIVESLWFRKNVERIRGYDRGGISRSAHRAKPEEER